MSWNLTTSEAAIAKAGSGANTEIVISGAALQKWSDDAEGTINALTRRDWVTESPNAATAGLISDIVSSDIAMNIVGYNMGSYNSITEAQTLLNILDNNFNKKMSELKTQIIRERM